ncbi:hypothetical protein Tco_0470986 [Tanacetum coccineum]
MSSAPGTSGVSGSSQLPPPPPPLSTDTTEANQYESSGLAATQETSPTDYLMNDDSIPDEQWKPLPEEERPATPEPGWTIPSSNVLDVEKTGQLLAIVPTYNVHIFERHDSLSHRREVRKQMRILSVGGIKAYSRYGDFEDLNMLLLQGHLDHLPGSDKPPRSVVFPVNNNEQKISDGTLTRILEALDYRVKEYRVNRLNLSMNTQFWTDKDVTRSKEFIHAIERRLKTRRIYRNLECFVGGRVRDIDYRILQRTE